VDAGELGAGHHATAVYEVELVPGAPAGDAAAGEVRLRWRSAESGETVEVRQPLTVGDDGPSPSLRLAALVAHTAEVLRGNTVVADRGVTLESLQAEADELSAMGVDGAAEMAELISTATYAEDPIPADTTSG
jgi:hypothetical protein